MKRLACIVGLALAVGFAAGAAGMARKYAYLPETLNRKVDLTEIELACIKSTFSAQRPLVLRDKRVLANEIRATPQTNHIQLEVQVELTGSEADPIRAGELEFSCAAVYKLWRERLLKRDIPDESKCPVTIDLLTGSKVRFRQIRDQGGARGFENPEF